MKSTKLLLFLCAMSPALLGAKCVEYDERYGTGATVNDATPAETGGGGPFMAAKPCDQPMFASIKIENRKFNIQCGCEEAEGKTCTIPAGTTVRWQFADSDDHNVAVKTLSPSGDKQSGIFENVFSAPGTYTYACTIHSDMRGYTIIVK